MPFLYLSEGEGELVQDGALVEELATIAVVVVLVHTLPHVLGQLVVPHVLVHLVQLGEGVGGAVNTYMGERLQRHC